MAVLEQNTNLEIPPVANKEASRLRPSDLEAAQAAGEEAFNDAWNDVIRQAALTGTEASNSGPPYVPIDMMVPHLESLDSDFAQGLVIAIGNGSFGEFLAEYGLVHNPYHSPGGAPPFAHMIGSISIQADTEVHGPGANGIGEIKVRVVDVPQSVSNVGWTEGGSMAVNMSGVESLHNALLVAFPEGTNLYPGTIEDVAFMVANNEAANFVSAFNEIEASIGLNGGSIVTTLETGAMSSELVSDYASMSVNRADLGRILASEVIDMLSGSSTSSGYLASQNLLIDKMAEIKGVTSEVVRENLLLEFQEKYAELRGGDTPAEFQLGNAIMETVGEALLSYSTGEIDSIVGGFGDELEDNKISAVLSRSYGLMK